jgi:beta-glucosidase
MTRRQILAGLCVLIVLFGAFIARRALNRSSVPVHADTSGTVAARVDALLSRMSLDEKIGQMTMVSVDRLWGDCNGQPGQLSEPCMKSVLGDQDVGSVLSGGGEAPQSNTPQGWVALTNGIQHYAVDKTALHIPVLYGEDAVHGDNNLIGATIYPQNLGMAATWDPALERKIEANTAATVLSTGIHWTFAPVSDIARDPRWGRYYETFGEDPVLASEMVASAVDGFQSVPGVAATAKHFVGYSGAVRGHDRTPADMSLRTLQQTYLPTFRAAVNGGVDTIMVDSGSVNGVPVHASHYLLTNVLRDQLGFKGVVVTDWQDIQSLYDRYHLASSYEDAIRIAILAGVDMSMVPYDTATYTADLNDLVQHGQIPRSRIDESVRRILTLKYRLGLFDHPYVAGAPPPASSGAARSLARMAADESMTLLENNGVLPLSASKGPIVVAGPVAASIPDEMGGWTVGWQGIPDGVTVPGVTVLAGVRQAVAGRAPVRYVSGTDASSVVRAAHGAQAVVLVVGETPYAEGMGDTETASLSSDQARLLKGLEGSNVKIVLVVVGGRPLIMPGVSAKVSALLMAWLPGTEGGAAVADALFGTVDPSGRLPVSWPRNIGQEPLDYQQLPGTNTGPDSTYDPQFTFGAGLSYTTFLTTGMSLPSKAAPGSTVHIQVTVQNTGARPGTDVVAIYAHPQDASVLVPAQRLVAFGRVTLAAHASRTVTISFPVSRLAVVPGDVDSSAPPAVEAGTYVITTDGRSGTLTVS